MNMRVHMMMCCTFLIACARCSSASCGMFEVFTVDALDSRILSVSSFPWLVSVQDHGGSHLAAGTIISEFWIVTVPSALKLRKDLMVVVGVTTTTDLHSRASYAIHKVIVHEEFDEILHRKDLMLLMTKDRIRFGHKVQPICFPSLDPHNSALSNCTVSGRRRLKDAGHSGSMSWCSLPVENTNPCPLQRTVSTECCIYRGHRDPGCVGTGGSPVSCQVKGKDRWLLAGVLSGAGMRPYFPVLYTRTSYYSDWISSRTTEVGQPFIPTVTINTVVLPQDQPHFRAAVKTQPDTQQEKDESMLYDYYNGDDIPKACGCSFSTDVHLILFVIFLTK